MKGHKAKVHCYCGMRMKYDKNVESLALFIAHSGLSVIVGVLFFIKAFAETELCNVLFPFHTADISPKAFTCLVDVHVPCNPSSYPQALGCKADTAGSPYRTIKFNLIL